MVCHCRANERCHGDVLVEEFQESHPTAYDRSDCHGAHPEPGVLTFMARLREEPDSDDGSSPDEGVPNKFAGHRGIGEPMQVGVGYTQRELCDGGSRLYPTSAHWNRISNVYRRFTDHHGTEELLVSLAMGKVDKCPFPLADIAGLRKELIDVAAEYGFHLERRSGNRTDVPIDFRFLHRLLVMAGDPEVDLGDYSQGVRVGPGTVMPRLPAFYRPKRKWRLASQHEPLGYLEQTTEPEGTWRRKYSTLETFEDQVLEFIHDQASRSQLLVFYGGRSKVEIPRSRHRFAGVRSERRRLVGRLQHACCSTGHMCINTRTRIRDQERAPIAADSKRTMREKAKLDELTFALTGDVIEAHGQVPNHPDDWHYLGCQAVPGGNVFVNTVGTFGIASASFYHCGEKIAGAENN